MLTIVFVAPTLVIVYNLAIDVTLMDATMSPLWRQIVSMLLSGLAGLISYRKLTQYADGMESQ